MTDSVYPGAVDTIPSQATLDAGGRTLANMDGTHTHTQLLHLALSGMVAIETQLDLATVNFFYVGAPTGVAATDDANLAAAITAADAAGGGWIIFESGLYAFANAHTLPARPGADTTSTASHRLTFIGAGAGTTVLQFTPASGIFLFNHGDGVTNAGGAVWSGMTVQLMNNTAGGAFAFNDPCRFNVLERVTILGNSSSHGIGVLMSGQVSANSFHRFITVACRQLLVGIQFSGFANSNFAQGCWCGVVGTGFLFDAFGSDTTGGDTNVVERCEFNGSTGLAISCQSNATSNTFFGVTCDGTTADFNISASSTGNMIIGGSYTPGHNTISSSSKTIIIAGPNVTAPTGVTSGFTAGAGTAMNSASTSTGGVGSTAYTFGDLVAAMKTAGLVPQ